ncbi:MAG TPA: riboflavin synthase [Acidimicrobiales bacterium]|nr:riboflavin synthase [Acidimicrobiales bacterium]
MFTGVVEELGRLERRDGGRFRFACTPGFLDGAAVGDSIAHNGACLTVVDLDVAAYEVDVVDETLARTNLGDLAVGDPVNLERPVRLQDRLGGHLVLGHVDDVGTVVSAAPDLVVALAPGLTRYVVEKGSITVDGCSLTVAAVEADRFRVAIIPHTAAVTTLGRARPGDRLNLEVDIMAKHAEKLLAAHLPGGSAA